MKCKVCGAESGRYVLCRACNIKKEKGEIIKCPICKKWHYANSPCADDSEDVSASDTNDFLYNPKSTLISNSEQSYFSVICSALPANYHAFPQANLASFIVKDDNVPFQNELFRNVDFLITDEKYKPLFVIEINDQTHLNSNRKDRDEKVKKICEEAGIPLVKFWTSYGVNEEYIGKKINETLSSLPVKRIHHFDKHTDDESETRSGRSMCDNDEPEKCKVGCYVATCVYGSYDCPEVWTLRRFRDDTLGTTWYGRAFIRIYYAISPILVKLFGKTVWFKKFWRNKLDGLIKRLREKGIEDTPYRDKRW